MGKNNSGLSERALNYIADSIQGYVDLVQISMILNDVTPEEYDKAMKTIKKTVKKLKKGDTKGIFDNEVLSHFADRIEIEAENYERKKESEYEDSVSW